jgi:von Willebrand factor type A domain
MDLDFLTPAAGLLALLVLIPLVAFARTRRVGRRTRARVGLPEPRRRFYAVPAIALGLTAGFLGVAAMQPVVSFDESHRVRTDAEVFFVLDTSRSMLASAAPGSASRLARAKAAATTLRGALPTVPIGLASVTDRTLPHIFPTADEDAFGATLQKSIGIERPPPVHALLTRVTSLESIAEVATQGFFAPAAKRRVLVVFTDGETLPGTRARLAPLFSRPPGIRTVFVHVWDRDERVFRGRTPEPAYRADPGSRPALDRLAVEIAGDVYGEDELGAAVQRLPELVGDGPTLVQGERREDVPLAPPLAAAAFLPLALLLWRRDR